MGLGSSRLSTEEKAACDSAVQRVRAIQQQQKIYNNTGKYLKSQGVYVLPRENSSQIERLPTNSPSPSPIVERPVVNRTRRNIMEQRSKRYGPRSMIHIGGKRHTRRSSSKKIKSKRV